MSRHIQEEMNLYAGELEHLNDDELFEEVRRARIAQQSINRIGRTRAIGKCYAANLELQRRFGAGGEKKYHERFGEPAKRFPHQRALQAQRSI